LRPLLEIAWIAQALHMHLLSVDKTERPQFEVAMAKERSKYRARCGLNMLPLVLDGVGFG